MNTVKQAQPGTVKAGPVAEKLIMRDEKVLSPSLPRSYPLAIDHASGAEVWDVDGKRYVDFMTGIAVVSTGHSHPAVVQAIKDQAEKFLHICLADFHYEIAVELAEKLDEIAPFAEAAQVFLTNSGAEAIEAAMKLARAATGRQQFIAFYGGFHGRTLGALSLTASKTVHKGHFSPLIPGVTHIPYPDENNQVLNSAGYADYGETVVAYLENVVFARKVPPDEVAAVVVEPIMGEGGYIIPPPGFFPALRAVCDRYGILLVADEIQSGIGRTGKWWAIEHFGVEPDIVTSAKGIASGMPLGAMIARKSLMIWEAGSHGSTFGGNPVSCAAAVATLKLIEGGMMQNAAEMGEYLIEQLCEFQTVHPMLDHIRGKGLMIGFDIVLPEGIQESNRVRDWILNEAFNRGLLLLGAGKQAIRLMPPLMLDRATADEAFDILDGVLGAIEETL